jgi:hypothetical protein
LVILDQHAAARVARGNVRRRDGSRRLARFAAAALILASAAFAFLLLVSVVRTSGSSASSPLADCIALASDDFAASACARSTAP